MIAKIAILIALLAAALGAGYGYGYGRGYAACAAADRVAIDGANDDATAAQRAVGAVKDKLAQLKTDHAAALAKAQAALGLRDNQLSAAKRALQDQLQTLQTEAGHDPDCTTLADLPVCPRVAAGLWPAANQTSARP